jgi:hypothetical protein
MEWCKGCVAEDRRAWRHKLSIRMNSLFPFIWFVLKAMTIRDLVTAACRRLTALNESPKRERRPSKIVSSQQHMSTPAPIETLFREIKAIHHLPMIGRRSSQDQSWPKVCQNSDHKSRRGRSRAKNAPHSKVNVAMREITRKCEMTFAEVFALSGIRIGTTVKPNDLSWFKMQRWFPMKNPRFGSPWNACIVCFVRLCSDFPWFDYDMDRAAALIVNGPAEVPLSTIAISKGDLRAVRRANFKGITNNVSCQFQTWSRLHWEWDSMCDSSEFAFADHLDVRSWGFTLPKRICRGSPKFHVWALCLLITWFWTDHKSRAHIKMAER